MYLILFLFSLILLGGCTSKEKAGSTEVEANEGEDQQTEENKQSEDNEEPVTLTIALPFGEDIFQDRYGVIQEKLPDLNLEMVYFDGTSEGLEELFASKTVPDIFNTGNVALLQEYDAILPMDELIEKHGFDTSVIDPSIVTFLRSFNDEQSMIGISDGASRYGLYYNKEIFDLFGVAYPDPDKPMTWDEVIELSRQLTGERNGTDYIGLEFNGNDFEPPLFQLAVNYTDPRTGEVQIADKPELLSFFNLVQDYYNIPGVEYNDTCFFCEKRAAMTVGWHGLFLWGWDDDVSNVENMDIAPLPVWPDLPNTAPKLQGWPIMISSYSEHPDEAFQVLMEYVSEENQLNMAKTVSAGPTTVYPKVLENFAADHEFYDGKNVPALFALDPALGEERRSAKWDAYVDIDKAIEELATTDIDVPTLLRKLEEESTTKIQNAKDQE